MNWQDAMFAAIYTAIRLYLGSGVYNRLYAAVVELVSNDTLSGADKMARVLELAQQEAVTASSYVLRGIIEFLVARAKAEG